MGTQVGMNSLECYETDFESALLEASADFYKRKAAAWIQVRPPTLLQPQLPVRPWFTTFPQGHREGTDPLRTVC